MFRRMPIGRAVWCVALFLLVITAGVGNRSLAQDPAKPAPGPDDGQGLKRLVRSGWKASWSPDAAKLVFGKPRGEGLQILDLRTGEITDLTDSGKDAAWSPDGQWIAYVKEPTYNDYMNEEVWLVKPDGEQPRKLADGGFPSWSTDGKTVFFHSRRQAKILTIRPDDPNSEPDVYFDRPQSWYPAISPDGRRIAFGGPNGLVVVERKTGETTFRMATPGARGLLAAWSPDGKQLAFGSFAGRFGLWVLDLKTNKTVQVAKGATYTMPAWSKDGTKLAFDRRGPTGNEVWMVETKQLARLDASPLPGVASAPPRQRPETGPRVGEPAPDIQAEDIDGIPFRLSDYRGQVVVLDFWGDW